MKVVCNLFIQGLFTIIGLYRIARYSKKMIFPNIKFNEIFILGNGPSLEKQLEDHLEFFLKKDLLCVNAMVNTKWYLLLKPHYYMLMDPIYYKSPAELSTYPKHFQDEVRTIVENIVRNTSWNMTVFLSMQAKSKIIVKRLSENKKIKIVYINTIDFKGFNFIKEKLLHTGRISPVIQNVLVGAIFVSILMKYKKIYILGAEHNWIKYINVEADNLLYDTSKHFYLMKKNTAVFYNPDNGEPIKMHELLFAFYHVFKGYTEIRELAEANSVTVLNLTPESFIDAFNRRNLDEVVSDYNNIEI